MSDLIAFVYSPFLPHSMQKVRTPSAHTAGPWILVDEGTYPGIDAEGQNIVLNSDLGEHCGVQGDSREQAIANARLIAAAPELLEACKGMLAFFVQYDTDNKVVSGISLILKDTIAKAEGHA